MPIGTPNPAPPRAVRSSSLSHVSGASTRRSSAMPFAAPRTSSIVPSVTMKGTTFRRVISRPLTRPQTAAAPSAPSAETAGL